MYYVANPLRTTWYVLLTLLLHTSVSIQVSVKTFSLAVTSEWLRGRHSSEHKCSHRQESERRKSRNMRDRSITDSLQNMSSTKSSTSQLKYCSNFFVSHEKLGRTGRLIHRSIAQPHASTAIAAVAAIPASYPVFGFESQRRQRRTIAVVPL